MKKFAALFPLSKIASLLFLSMTVMGKRGSASYRQSEAREPVTVSILNAYA